MPSQALAALARSYTSGCLTDHNQGPQTSGQRFLFQDFLRAVCASCVCMRESKKDSLRPSVGQQGRHEKRMASRGGRVTPDIWERHKAAWGQAYPLLVDQRRQISEVLKDSLLSLPLFENVGGKTKSKAGYYCNAMQCHGNCFLTAIL